MTTVSSFRPDLTGTFIDRPNRFIARVEVEGRVVEAHCPNPGRLTELLFPGSEVFLERARAERKLAYTLAAVVHPGATGPVVVPLASVRANEAVGTLALPLLFPGARKVQPEFTLGSSRFDFLVEDREGGRHLIEVKACSEVEFGTALFPDAPSDRARKHLAELAHWSEEGYRPHVVFAVVHGRPRAFGPNAHTDPGFARDLAAWAPKLDLRALLFETGADGQTRLLQTDLPIDLGGAAGPDAGLVVRMEPGEGAWTVGLERVDQGWERAAARGPARRTLAVRGGLEGVEGLEKAWAAAGGQAQAPGLWRWPRDPRTDRAFVAAVMALRHR